MKQSDVDWSEWGVKIRSALAVLVSIGVLLGGAWFVYSKVNGAWVAYRTRDDYAQGEGKADVNVLIPQGASLTQIADILVEKKVIKARKTFREAASKDPKASGIQAGRYKLRTEISSKQALDMLLDPKSRVRLKVQLKEGLTMEQQWAEMAKQLNLKPEQFKAAIAKPQAKLPKWADGNLEGLLFPETYEVQEPADPGQIMTRQVEQFNKLNSEMGFEKSAAAVKLTPRQLLTVASIIEREAGSAKDRPIIASVIYNRLAKGMPLQMDSTVHYAVKRYDTVTTTDAERQTDSPYNTYKVKGLPPGPICSPGKSSMLAAMNPAETNFLYFVTVDLDSKETKFAVTDTDHNKNVAQFQKWCQAHSGRC